MTSNQKIINTLVSETLFCDITTLTPEKRLVKDLLADSISFIDLITRVSDHFKIDISEQDLSSVHRLSDLYQVIDKYTQQEDCK